MINSSVYIYGYFGSGYTQYPDNYAKGIYQEFSSHASSKSQIIIHRDKDLMYYGYVRKLDTPSHYIGFCVLINDLMFTDVNKLFPVFENAVTSLVYSGEIIALNDQADIYATTSNVFNKLHEVNNIVSMIKNGIDRMDSYTKKLPPVDYSLSNVDWKYFTYSDPNEKIVNASCKYPYTYIAKDKGFNTSTLSGYKGVINRLRGERNEFYTKYDELKSQYNKLNKQKKQYRNVVVLCLIVVLCGIGLFLLNQTLNTTQQSLEKSYSENKQKTNTIKNKNSKIINLNMNISNLKASLFQEQSKRENIEKELNSLKDIYRERQPLFIKNTSFNFNSGRLSFDYYGYFEKTIKLKVIAFDGDYLYTNSTTFIVEKGHHSSSIYLSRNLSSSQWYLFELLIGNKIIGGDRH